MFGRRNPDTVPTPTQQPPDEATDLDLLPDLPLTPSNQARTTTAQPFTDSSPFERAWQSEQTAYQPNVPQPTPFSPPPALVPAPFTTAVAPVPAPASPHTAGESVIGPDDFFDGNYRSERGVRLQGTVRGSIESRQYIFVEAGAKVEANLSAEEITVAGEFNGAIECRGRLEITETGSVHGQVTTATLVVKEGGQLDGELHMRREG